MMTIPSPISLVREQAWRCVVLLAMLLFLGQSMALADDRVMVLMKQVLADAPGKQVTMLTVVYDPGATSEAHVHPGSVFAYVLEGSVISQVEGEKPVTYTKGQSWYEHPKQPHLVSKNASEAQPARLLVFLLSQEGEAIKTPLTSSHSAR
jgi:quercetin dioxygenase-like cupin family protein